MNSYTSKQNSEPKTHQEKNRRRTTNEERLTNNKINASTNTTDYNKPYDPNANTNYYPNPKPVTPTTNANTEALDQKLAELKQQQYQPQQSTRINDPNATKKYDVTTVKERVPDKATEEYDGYLFNFE